MYIRRLNQPYIYRSFKGDFITVILGPRRVGKTTLIEQYAKENNDKKWVFLNMDYFEEKLRVEKGELKALIQEKALKQIGEGETLWVVIDEAQKCPLLFNQIKALYDQYKSKKAIKFILTGSGFLSLHQLSAESLAGRTELFYLREFGLQEAVALKHQITRHDHELFEIACKAQDMKQLESYIESRAPLKSLFQESLLDQLVWGGMPEILQMQGSNAKLTYLSNYLQTYFEKDIRAISTIDNLNLYQKLLEITAEQTGSVRQDKTILEALGCARDTLKKYRGFLLATFLYKEVYPFINSTLKRLVKSPKGYLLNNGLISYLTGIDDANILQKTGLIGHRFENWFLKELLLWLDDTPRRSEIYYWRTSGGVEVDFIAIQKPLIFPFEITYSTQIHSKKIKNLKYFLKNEPKVSMGFYVYMGEFYYDKQAKICFLPAWAVG